MFGHVFFISGLDDFTRLQAIIYLFVGPFNIVIQSYREPCQSMGHPHF